ncbi:MAG: Crp/Fnr family transcriptional regulator [Pseudomonadota bacterium]
MNNTERFPHLTKAPIFNELPKPFVKSFLDRCAIQTVQRKTQILREGVYPDAFYIVAHGTIDIFSESATGHRVLFHRAGQGETVGELELIANKVCTATCETGENALLLVCSKPQLFEAVRNPNFLRNLMQVLYTRLDRSNKFKVVDSCYPIEQRLCAYLKYLSARNLVITENQLFLAELIGCSRQTINRELRVLRDLGIIETHNSRIEILDQEGLSDLAQPRVPS